MVRATQEVGSSRMQSADVRALSAYLSLSLPKRAAGLGIGKVICNSWSSVCVDDKLPIVDERYLRC